MSCPPTTVQNVALTRSGLLVRFAPHRVLELVPQPLPELVHFLFHPALRLSLGLVEPALCLLAPAAGDGSLRLLDLSLDLVVGPAHLISLRRRAMHMGCLTYGPARPAR